MSERIYQAFSRFVAARSDAGLERLMAGRLRRPLLWSIFHAAQRRLRVERRRGVVMLARAGERMGGVPG